MKRLLFILSISLLCSSCIVFYGPNYNNSKNVQQLYIGMSKQDAIQVMGKDYIVESTSQQTEGVFEVLKYDARSDVPYLLQFLNGKLVVFNKYYPPYMPPYDR